MVDWLDSLAASVGLTLGSVVWTVSLGVLLFLGSIFMVTVLVVYLPATYFLDSHQRNFWIDRHPALRWTALVVKNLIGVVLVIAGAAMLLGPGQGVLTILIGVMLLDFPGRRWLELKLLARPGVIAALNRLRARFGREALQIDLPIDPPTPPHPKPELVTSDTQDRRG